MTLEAIWCKSCGHLRVPASRTLTNQTHGKCPECGRREWTEVTLTTS